MNELIKIQINEQQEPVISARELHRALEVKKQFTDWWEQQQGYGFEENQDFAYTPISVNVGNGATRQVDDYAMKLDMAKELAMVSRTEKGKEVRKYFIQIEKDWNSPEKVMARALKFAEERLNTLQLENAQQKQIIGELQPKATYYDLILQNKSLLAISVIAKDYGMSATKMNKILNELGVQYKQKNTWLLYSRYQAKGYTSSKTQEYIDSKGNPQSKLHTYWTQKGRLFIYDLLKQHGILPMIEGRSKRSVSYT